MLRNLVILFIFCASACFPLKGWAGGEVHAGICVVGSVSDPQEKLAYASVFLLQDGIFRYGTHTDHNGNFELHEVEPGKYSLVVSWAGVIQYERGEFMIPEGSNFILDIVVPELLVPESAEIASEMRREKRGLHIALPEWLRNLDRRTDGTRPIALLAALIIREEPKGRGLKSWVYRKLVVGLGG